MLEIGLFLVGIVVGVMNAIAGGGTLIGFPVLLASGLTPIVANATSHIMVLPGSLTAAFAYRKQLRTVPRSFLWLTIPCLIGAVIGAIILRYTSLESFEKIVPALVLSAVVLFTFQPLLHFHLHTHMRRRKHTWGPILMFSLAILPLAIYGGYFGAGFGFIMLSFLGFTSLKDTHKINALKNLAVACITTASVLTLWGSNMINWRFGLIMAGGNLIGGYGGAVIAQKVSSHIVRIVVIAIGMSTAIYLGLRYY